MPELGDVEGFRRVVAELRGALIERVDVLDPEVLRNTSVVEFGHALRGQLIGSVSRVGKWLSIEAGERALLVHFGMTGSLRHVPSDARPEPFVRVVIATDRGDLRFRDQRRLGRWYLLNRNADPSAVTGRLGPDALSLPERELRSRLSGARGAVKSALMDQTRLAGIGNFLSDEICWRAGVHPGCRVSALDESEWAALGRAVRSVLHAAARAGHTPRGPRWLTGARWSDDRRCPTCSTPLADDRVGGRHATWCPRCQPSC